MKLFERIHRLGVAKGFNKTEHCKKLGLITKNGEANVAMYNWYLNTSHIFPEHILINAMYLHDLTKDDITRMRTLKKS